MRYFICVLVVLLCPLPLPAAERPNILFVYLDDMGWKDTGFAGSDFYETPHLDRLARGGLVFTNAYSCAAVCSPARASLLSGQYTPRHGIFNVGTGPRGDARYRRLAHVPVRSDLRPEIVTWAEALKGQGYRTALFGKWHLGVDPRTQGFDVVIEARELAGGGRHYMPDGTYLTDELTSRTIGFIRANRDGPWVAYLAHRAVHTPLQPKKELLPKYRKKPPAELHKNVAMATMVQAVDDGVGRLVAALKELGLRDRTAIFFSSDNGGNCDGGTDMDPLWGYKGTYYEGGIRVPMFVHWPGVVAPGQTTDEPVIGVDFYPTFLEMTGAERPDQPLDGKSLLPLLAGKVKTLGQRPLYWHFPGYLETFSTCDKDEQRDPLFRTRPCSIIRLGPWKLHEYFEDGALELYNLDEDIRERHNLADRQPERRKAMHARLKAWRDAIGAPAPTERNPRYDPAAEAAAIQRRLKQ